MSNAKALTKLSGPVGAEPRPETSKGAKVRNAAADVFIVRKMLAAAGQKVSSTGKADKKFVDAIKAFQKKIGFKYPDGVIDPGGKTFKTLAKRAEKALAADGGAIDVVVVRIDGEELGIPQKDYDVAVALTCKKLARVVNGMRGHYDIVAENAQFYIDAATGASGFMDALVMWSSSLKANLDPPYFPAQAKAMVSLQRAEKAVASKDVKKAVAAMPTAQADINAFAKQVKVYGDKFCGGAKDMQESSVATLRCFRNAVKFG